MTDAAVPAAPGAAGPLPPTQATLEEARTAPAASTPPEINWFVLIMGFAAMVIGQFMAILDIQIVASSITEIQAGVGATADEISWIQTSYLIAEVVMIPLSGYLQRWWGTRRLFLTSALGFTVMSVMVGLSSSIDEMILFRGLQGFLGGAMIPTVFSVAFTAFPGKHRVTASVVMSLIVSLAPTIGPTLGGHISDTLGWRWLFFINVPPAIPMMFLVWRYADFDKGDPKLAKGFDWWGLAFMAAGLMSMQFVLEEGARNNWFEEAEIVLLTPVAVLGLAAFVWRSLTFRNPIVELRAVRDKNFAVGVFLTFIVGAALFGGTFVLPLFMGQILGYSASQIGITMAVSGVVMFVTGPIAGRLARVLRPRFQMAMGMIVCGFGFWLGRDITPDWGFWQFAGLQAFRAFGVMFAMLASQNVTMATIPPAMIKNASGLVNLSRNVGGAVGLAVIATLISNRTAYHMADVTAGVQVTDFRVQQLLQGLAQRLAAAGSPDPQAGARLLFERLLEREAATLAFADVFVFTALMLFIGGAVAWVLGPKNNPQAARAPGSPPAEPAH